VVLQEKRLRKRSTARLLRLKSCNGWIVSIKKSLKISSRRAGKSEGKVTDKKSKLVSAVELAEYLGITVRHISRISLILKQVERGKFDLKTSVRAFCEYLKEQVKFGGSPGLIEQRTRLAKVNADRREFEFAVLRQKYLDRALMERFLSGIMIHIRTQVMSIPQKVAPQVGGSFQQTAEIFSLVERYCRDALEAASNLDIKTFQSYTGSGEEDQPAKSKPKKGKKKKDGHGKK